MKDLNRDLLSLVLDDVVFGSVVPMLFGDGFIKTVKERVKAMRCIGKISTKTTESFFQKGCPQVQCNQPPPLGRQQSWEGTFPPLQRSGREKKRTSTLRGRRSSPSSKETEDCQNNVRTEFELCSCVCSCQHAYSVSNARVAPFFPIIHNTAPANGGHSPNS